LAVESEPQVTGEDYSQVELALALRNHGFPLETLRYDITPLGLHYLLIHFDIPHVDVTGWKLDIGGHVSHPMSLSLDEIKERPKTSIAVTLECAGNGRSRFSPRPLSQPWQEEAIGHAEWTGTPLAPLLEESGVEDGAVEVLFTGLDRGLQGVVHPGADPALSGLSKLVEGEDGERRGRQQRHGEQRYDQARTQRHGANARERISSRG
jgi:DMSO/TMAO reductase YedYZ molybdopterin-dependent catalytic subunit